MDQDVQKALDVLRRHEYREPKCTECKWLAITTFDNIVNHAYCQLSKFSKDMMYNCKIYSKDLSEIDKNAKDCDEYKYFEEA